MKVTHRRQKLGLLGIVVAVGLIASACTSPVFGTAAGPIRHGTLYSDSGNQYTFTADDSTVTAAAPSPSDPSIREAFWRTETPYYDDQQACITWFTNAASPGGEPVQPGLAMRIAPTGTDGKGIKAVTVTENVWSYGVWIFNVHTWDTTKSGSPFTLVGQFDLWDLVITSTVDENGDTQLSLVPPPWHVCARTLGNQFTFKLWTGSNPEPAWDDPTHVFTTTLPDGWDYAGYSGGYIGHLHDGQSASFSAVTTMPLCLAPDMVNTPRCQELLGATSTTSAAPSTSTTVPAATTTVAPSTTTTVPADSG